MPDDESFSITAHDPRAAHRMLIEATYGASDDPDQAEDAERVRGTPVVGFVLVFATALPDGRSFGVLTGNAADQALPPWDAQGLLVQALANPEILAAGFESS